LWENLTNMCKIVKSCLIGLGPGEKQNTRGPFSFKILLRFTSLPHQSNYIHFRHEFEVSHLAKWVQRPVLNFDPRGELWPQGQSCPPGVNFVPWGWNSLFSPPFFLTVESVHPWGWKKGWTFPLGDQFNPSGPSSPLGVKLRMALCHTSKLPSEFNEYH
jgi:hypothetical protein